VGLQRAQWIVSLLSGLQWTVSALTALGFGWAASRVAVRALYSAALLLAVVGTACYVFMVSEPLAWASALLTGALFGACKPCGSCGPTDAAVGAVVGTTLAYYARSLDTGHLVLPLFVFYFALNVFPGILSSMIDCLIDLGLVRLDLVWHAMFYLILSAVLLLGMSVGFVEIEPQGPPPVSAEPVVQPGRSPGSSAEINADADGPRGGAPVLPRSRHLCDADDRVWQSRGCIACRCATCRGAGCCTCWCGSLRCGAWAGRSRTRATLWSPPSPAWPLH
jgi:MFS family permease